MNVTARHELMTRIATAEKVWRQHLNTPDKRMATRLVKLGLLHEIAGLGGIGYRLTEQGRQSMEWGEEMTKRIMEGE